MSTEVVRSEMSLIDTITHLQKLKAEAEAGGSDFADESRDQLEMALAVQAGKIDQACWFLDAIDRKVEVLEAQIEYLRGMHQKGEAMLQQATEAAGGKLEGETWKAYFKKNPPSTIIEAIEKVPAKYLDVTFSKKFKYDEEQIRRQISVELGRVVNFKTDLTQAETTASVFYRLELTKDERDLVESKFVLSPSKRDIATALKTQADSVPGARLESGVSFKYDAGKIKPKMIKGE